MSNYFEIHREVLEKAVGALESRKYFSAYPEIPSGRIYGENAKKEGEAAYGSRLNKKFDSSQVSNNFVGQEKSPWGPELGIKYPFLTSHDLLDKSMDAFTEWKSVRFEERLGLALEWISRLNKRSFEMSHAVMHTTGQSWVMAFQAGGPHAQDRALESVAWSYKAMKLMPSSVIWSKKVSKDETVNLKKNWKNIPLGISVAIGCSTFPTWNTYPGIFASFVCGNTIIVKPHPQAILPLAITMEIGRELLKSEGLSQDIIQLAPDEEANPIATDLVSDKRVSIVDYTGGSKYGCKLREKANHTRLYSEESGVNPCIIESVDDLKLVICNLAFSLCLYSGQMCTTPQNIFISEEGIKESGKNVPFDEVVNHLVQSINQLLKDPETALGVLGAIVSQKTIERVKQSVMEASDLRREPQFNISDKYIGARTCSPMISVVDAESEQLWNREMFGPIVYIVKTKSHQESVELAVKSIIKCGAITASLYSTNNNFISLSEQVLSSAGVALSINLLGNIFVNQSAAFSDLHVSGCNPSGNATLCDIRYVADRFRTVQTRFFEPNIMEPDNASI